ncbi:MAG: hypothetical protein A2041_03220 [Bacteroidetes bacterium GWA2_31_9b]|nr:MAG: hypothetical protein A2041_03220 [Bacteroidetes bacterium GWA2_31_9b]
MRYLIQLVITLFFLSSSCANTSKTIPGTIKTGAEQTEKYIYQLKGKNIALVANHTSVINKTHLLDTLLSLNVQVKQVFSPEHGFRGNGDAGEPIHSFIDEKTGLPVISLYGSNKKPTKESLQGIDIVIFDLQDVGVRFYTYISTMHYVMEACAENNVELLILDRPNPNGFYVDGPVLDTNYRSFVGMHPVPIVHGMTIAEYAQMINGEGWLKNNIQCKLKYISCENYTHDSLYKLPVPPSPNLQNMQAVYLYPSLGFFEGTVLNVGRGTDFPFQVFGSPDFKNSDFSYTPRSIDGASKFPPHENQKCFGIDLRNYPIDKVIKSKSINLDWIVLGYSSFKNSKSFFNSYFYNISGTKQFKEQIIQKKTAQEIHDSWNPELEKFKNIRKKYLIYDDFK